MSDFDKRNELADELTENGMDDVAAELRRFGIDAARAQANEEIAFLRQYPDSDQLTGNLETALERLDWLENEDEDERSQRVADAGADVVDALAKLYEACDGDDAQVGECLYEIDKAARIRYAEGLT